MGNEYRILRTILLNYIYAETPCLALCDGYVAYPMDRIKPFVLVTCEGAWRRICVTAYYELATW